tara:strand:- start:209 stop:1177 length:969 start_codon:yes stop_codon:yes gene_type:complete
MSVYFRNIFRSLIEFRHFVPLMFFFLALAWCAIPYEIVLPVIIPDEEFPVPFYVRQVHVYGYPFILQGEAQRSVVRGLMLNAVFWMLLLVTGELLQRQLSRSKGVRDFKLANCLVLLLTFATASFFAWEFVRRHDFQSQILDGIKPEIVHVSDAIPSTIRASLPNYSNTFTSIVAVSCEASDLEQLSSIRSIEMIELQGEATNAELERLQNFPNLVSLSINYVTVKDDATSDASVQPMLDLPQLSHLKSLTVIQSAYSGGGLSRLVNLQRLELSNTNIDETAFAAILRLKELRRLIIYGYRLSDAQQADISLALPGCEVLNE